MPFNYEHEKRKFELMWKSLDAQYRAAGMTDEDIETLKEFDWNWFLSERRYRIHTLELSDSLLTAGLTESGSSPTRRKELLKSATHEHDLEETFNWLDNIDDPELYGKLMKLSDSDMELISLLAVYGLRQTDIALLKHTGRQNINNKLSRIKKHLK